MKRLGIAGAIALLLFPAPARAQHGWPRGLPIVTDTAPADTLTKDSVVVDTVSRDTATVGAVAPLLNIGRHQHIGFAIASGKTYNRVEGLPILLGPTYALDAPAFSLHVGGFGIARTGRPLRFAAPDGGYDSYIDARFGRLRRWGLGVRFYSVVSPTARWTITEPEAGLAAFLLRRDYLDYYNRHGAKLSLNWLATPVLSLTASVADERWMSIVKRNPFSLFRSGQPWRINPRLDDGEVTLFTLDATFDTRNDRQAPASGWLLTGTYEYGQSDAITRVLPFPTPAPPYSAPTSMGYGRLFLDLRRYNRLSPRTQLNARVVAGGWLHGDALPLQRRLSIAGPGTMPGYDVRRPVNDVDVLTCQRTTIPTFGRPVMCDRAVLGQLEFRAELAPSPFPVSNSPAIRLRRAGFTARPVGVLFTDIGRGWRTDGMDDWPSSYKMDVGAGIDLGLIGVYLAKAVTDWSEPPSLFLRVRRRF